MALRTFVALAVCAVVAGTVDGQPWQTAGPIVYYNGGNVGIGTANPSQLLEVNGNIRSTPSTGSFSVGGAAPAGYQFYATSATAIVSTGFQLRSNYANTATSFIGNFGDFGTWFSQNREPQAGGFVNAAAAPNQMRAVHVGIGDVIRGRMFQLVNFPGGNEAPRMIVDYSGKVGIGTTTPSQLLDVNGNINVSGNINAKYQDIAEWVESSTTIKPGTVVVLDPERTNAVIPSGTAYDTSAAGVVSAQPGISLGEASPSKVQVATAGRVRVKVDATKNPVRIGDLLVTSNRPGMAMKSVPIDVNGIKIHRPGTLLGKALEPLDKGVGEILVLLSMQ